MDGIEINEFFYNGFPTNWTMWTFCLIMFLYFLALSFEEEEMNIFYHKSEFWSHHPIYSINKQVTDMATKTKKMAFLFVRMLSQLLFMSLFNRFFSYTHLAIKLVLFPLGGIVWSIIPVYLIGMI